MNMNINKLQPMQLNAINFGKRTSRVTRMK